LPLLAQSAERPRLHNHAKSFSSLDVDTNLESDFPFRFSFNPPHCQTKLISRDFHNSNTKKLTSEKLNFSSSDSQFEVIRQAGKISTEFKMESVKRVQAFPLAKIHHVLIRAKAFFFISFSGAIKFSLVTFHFAVRLLDIERRKLFLLRAMPAHII
jgi:hypothetical protein